MKAVSSVEDTFNSAKKSYDTDSFITDISNNDIRKDEKKISSKLEFPFMLLEQTPKILPLFRKFATNAIIVGFKLLSGTSSEELIDTAYSMLLATDCDFVLANDYSTISAGEHQGYLINGRFSEHFRLQRRQGFNKSKICVEN